VSLIARIDDRRRLRTDRGVTMLELLVALAVVGGLWAAAYPNVQTARERAQSLPATTLDADLDAGPVTGTGPDATVLGVTLERTVAAGVDTSASPAAAGERCFLVRVGAAGSTTEPVPCSPPTAAP
jgi:prepilin-type N-terminal cleavage/methylation domain-containing protein